MSISISLWTKLDNDETLLFAFSFAAAGLIVNLFDYVDLVNSKPRIITALLSEKFPLRNWRVAGYLTGFFVAFKLDRVNKKCPRKI